MSEQPNKDSFVRAFLPGLVIGLLVGAFGGAVLVPMLSDGRSTSGTAADTALPPDANPPTLPDPIEPKRSDEPPPADAQTPPADPATQDPNVPPADPK